MYTFKVNAIWKGSEDKMAVLFSSNNLTLCLYMYMTLGSTQLENYSTENHFRISCCPLNIESILLTDSRQCESELSSRGGPEWKARQYLFRIICFGLRKWVWKDAVTLFFIVALGMSQHRHGTPLRDTRTSNFGQCKCSSCAVFFLVLVRDWKRFVTSPAQWVPPWEPTIWCNFSER